MSRWPGGGGRRRRRRRRLLARAVGQQRRGAALGVVRPELGLVPLQQEGVDGALRAAVRAAPVWTDAWTTVSCGGARALGICSRVAPEAVLLALGALAGRERRRDLSRCPVAERVLLLDDAAVVVAHRLAVDVPGALRRGLALREEHRRRRRRRLGRRRRERRARRRAGRAGRLGGTSLHAPSWSRRSSGWSCSSHSRSRKSRHGASAHSANLQSPNPSGSAADEPSQLCQHADGSQKPTSPETKPLMRHVDSICAISRQAARCVRPSVASLQMARVRRRTSLSTNMRSERAWMLGGGGGAGARQWPSALPAAAAAQWRPPRRPARRRGAPRTARAARTCASSRGPRACRSARSAS